LGKRATKVRRNSIGGPFVHVLTEEMDSKAFMELNGSAVKALLWFRRVDGKLQRKEGYTGEFGLTYTEMQRYGFAKKTFSNVIKELAEKGFIEVVSAGGLRGAGHTTSKYKLSSRWRLYHLEMKPRFDWRYPSEPGRVACATAKK
jgi:hypothetical protein